MPHAVFDFAAIHARLMRKPVKVTAIALPETQPPAEPTPAIRTVDCYADDIGCPSHVYYDAGYFIFSYGPAR